MKNQTTTTINDQPYDIFITIQSDKSNIGGLVYSNVVNIILKDTIYSPFFNVLIEYVDDLHAFEKASNMQAATVLDKVYKAKNGYRYRGDGHDIVELKITPTNMQMNDDTANCIEFNCKLGVVNAYRTFNPEFNKYTKTLILEDYALVVLRERQSFFTTLNKDIKHPTLCSNEQRSLLTGYAIAQLISETFGAKYVDKTQWDKGSQRIYYSAGANEKKLDTLLTLCKLHSSEHEHINDRCFLSHDMSDNMWRLDSLYTLYSNAIEKSGGECFSGPLHIDTNIIDTSNNKTSNTCKYIPKDAVVNINSSRVISYDFNDIQASDAVNLNSHIVYNYNIQQKQFTIDCKLGNLSGFRSFFYDNYIVNMIGKNNTPYPNIPLSQIKLTNKSTNNVFTVYDNHNVSYGQNIMLDIANLLNNSIEITTPGHMLRRAGVFISVGSLHLDPVNDFDSKLYGVYLVDEIVHTFKGTAYTNTMICTKPYVFNRPENEPKEIIYG